MIFELSVAKPGLGIIQIKLVGPMDLAKRKVTVRIGEGIILTITAFETRADVVFDRFRRLFCTVWIIWA